MRRSIFHLLTVSFLGVLLIACGKNENAPASGSGKAAVDTNVNAEPIQISDTSHHLFFRPSAGTTERYHVIEQMNASFSDTPPSGQITKHSSANTTEYFLHLAVKAVNKDSSVAVTLRIDSIHLNAVQDTQKINYSSNNPKDRASDQYRQFNLIVEKDFTVKTNKYGDLMDITDASSIADALMATLPDSLKKDPRIKPMATRQADQMVAAYAMQVLAHSPARALIKDTTWRNVADVNMPISEGLSSPVTMTATQTVRGLEKRGDKILAVLEDNTTATPKKLVNEEGPVKETFSNFVVNSHAVTRLDDATGLLYQLARSEKRAFTFIVEDKNHSGQKRTVSQSGSQTVNVELLQ